VRFVVQYEGFGRKVDQSVARTARNFTAEPRDVRKNPFTKMSTCKHSISLKQILRF